VEVGVTGAQHGPHAAASDLAFEKVAAGAVGPFPGRRPRSVAGARTEIGSGVGRLLGPGRSSGGGAMSPRESTAPAATPPGPPRRMCERYWTLPGGPPFHLCAS